MVLLGRSIPYDVYMTLLYASTTGCRKTSFHLASAWSPGPQAEGSFIIVVSHQ